MLLNGPILSAQLSSPESFSISQHFSLILHLAYLHLHQGLQHKSWHCWPIPLTVWSWVLDLPLWFSWSHNSNISRMHCIVMFPNVIGPNLISFINRNSKGYIPISLHRNSPTWPLPAYLFYIFLLLTGLWLFGLDFLSKTPLSLVPTVGFN